MSRMMQSAQEKRMVLVADDDDDWRDLLVATLESVGYEVVQATDGKDLQLKLAALADAGKVPDLVVSDHRMPHATGLEVLEWARNYGPKVPFIILSAVAGPYIRQPALSLGAIAVLDKPVDLNSLKQQIVAALADQSVGAN